MYKDSSRSSGTVERQVSKLKRYRTNLEDERHERRPKSLSMLQIMAKITDMVFEDC